MLRPRLALPVERRALVPVLRFCAAEFPLEAAGVNAGEPELEFPDVEFSPDSGATELELSGANDPMALEGRDGFNVMR